MLPNFEFSFDDLPLIIENGFEAGEVNGTAEIAYAKDGEWSIRGISLDGTKRLRPTVDDILRAHASGQPCPIFLRRSVDLDAGTPIYLAIYHRLENEWADQIAEAVRDQIDGDKEYAADHARDLRKNWEAAL